MATQIREKPRSTLRQRRTKELKEHLINVTIQVLAQDGWGASTTAEVCRRADISEGSLFWHFGSREGLLTAVVIELNRRFLAAVQPPLADPNLTHAEKMVEFVRRYVRRGFDHFDDFRASIMISSDSGLYETMHEDLRQLAASEGQLLGEFMEGSIRWGLIRSVPLSVAVSLMAGAIQGALVFAHNHPGTDIDFVFNDIVRAGLALYGLDETGKPLPGSPGATHRSFPPR